MARVASRYEQAGRELQRALTERNRANAAVVAAIQQQGGLQPSPVLDELLEQAREAEGQAFHAAHVFAHLTYAVLRPTEGKEKP